MKEAIERYLDQEESAEHLTSETLERWERYEATGEHISHDAITAWLETLGYRRRRSMPEPRRLIWLQEAEGDSTPRSKSPARGSRASLCGPFLRVLWEPRR